MKITYASYATLPENSRGRFLKEEEGRNRTPYQRDRDRIIHSSAFRRLEYKTQVFVNHEGDHFRTRLTHSLEVAQLARSISRELGLNEDLAEALALAHDLGHPPFGHAGEEALENAMEKFGGFDHNAQGLRILTKLERKYANFDGLNLTWETLEGIAKHNGPVKSPPRALKEVNQKINLELSTYPGLEAQIASLCDDIAYNNHDIEDGFRARLFTLEDVENIPFVGDIFKNVLKNYPDIEEDRLIHETKRRMINIMVEDLVKTTIKNLKKHNIKTVKNIRNAQNMIAAFSGDMQKNIESMRKFLSKHMYRHYKVNRMTSKASRLIKELFEFLLREPECLPADWNKLSSKPNTTKTAEVVTDYISGMTDRFALEEHKRIFDVSYKLIGA